METGGGIPLCGTCYSNIVENDQSEKNNEIMYSNLKHNGHLYHLLATRNIWHPSCAKKSFVKLMTKIEKSGDLSHKILGYVLAF